jgi:leukotriene-A4 hydrolase
VFGTALISFQSIIANVCKVTLDLKNVQVDEVIMDSTKLTFNIIKIKGEDYPLGTPLEILLNKPLEINQKFDLTIAFRTTPKSEALQWLGESQTLGKKHPFMFSQCQAILCRGLLPCQVYI